MIGFIGLVFGFSVQSLESRFNIQKLSPAQAALGTLFGVSGLGPFRGTGY